MDFKKLANLLYPDVNKTPEDWEKRYPKRNLSQGAEVTRFAPSPTGFLHIGNFASAMYDARIAIATGGVFFFRLEDTDQKRKVEGAEHVALHVLKKYGVVPDEGLMADGSEKGNYGPYRQSERLEIYQTYAKKLVEEGKAFPCFCEAPQGKEAVLEKRECDLDENQSLEEKDPCRNLTLENVEHFLKNGRPFALRLLSKGKPGDRVRFVDEVRGEREFQKNCKDVVLMKSNGIPPYCFAHAIDDHLMRTTVVVRGEEWLSTLPQHLEIFDALGFEQMRYIHIPLISKIGEDGNKRKISKRFDPEADMRHYGKIGMPTESVVEYVLNLENSNFEIWRSENPEKNNLEFPFTISKIGSSSPLFDMVKLEDVSKNYISKLTSEEVFSRTLSWAEENDSKFAEFLKNNEEYSKKVFSIDRGNEKPRKDIAKWSDVEKYLGFMFPCFEKLSEVSDFEIDENTNREDLKLVLTSYSSVVSGKDEKQSWFDRIKEMAGQLGFATDNKLFKQNPTLYKGNIALVCEYIRIALTGKKNSPDLYTIISVLGETETKKRLDNLAKIL